MFDQVMSKKKHTTTQTYRTILGPDTALGRLGLGAIRVQGLDIHVSGLGGPDLTDVGPTFADQSMGQVLLVQVDGAVFASSAGDGVIDTEHDLLAHKELAEEVAGGKGERLRDERKSKEWRDELENMRVRKNIAT